MRKLGFLTGCLLLSALAGTASASTLNLGTIVTPAGSITVFQFDPGPNGENTHPYGEDGVLFSEPTQADSWLTTQFALNGARPLGLGEAQTILSALGLPSSLLASRAPDVAITTSDLLALISAAPFSQIGPRFAAAEFTLPSDDLGVSAQASPMPEPMSLLLVGAGLAGLGAVIRRRRVA